MGKNVKINIYISDFNFINIPNKYFIFKKLVAIKILGAALNSSSLVIFLYCHSLTQKIST